MIYIRSALFNVLFYAMFLVISVIGLPMLALPRRAGLKVVQLWSKASVRLLTLVCGVKFEFRNLHLLPKGACVIAVKHQSFLETFALITVLDDFSYVLKKELLNVPLFGWYARRTQQIGIDRNKRAGAIAKMLRAVRDRLAAGRQVVIFPEGTRRRVGAAPLYKTGIAAICAAADAPCTPVALNTGLFWPRRSFLRRPGTVVFEFLPPIPAKLDKGAFMAALKAAIEPATDALVAETLAANPDLDRALTKKKPASRDTAEREPGRKTPGHNEPAKTEPAKTEASQNKPAKSEAATA